MSPLALTLLSAGGATALCLAVGTPLAAWLARPFRGRWIAESVVSLPLALPPTVVGWALIDLLGRGTAFGRWLNDTAGIHLLFTAPALALAAAVLALPLYVRTASAALEAVDRELLEAGRTLGATEATLVRAVVLPLAWRGIAAGAALAFARAAGEFGAALMVGGQIPGQTETAAIALWNAVEMGDADAARRQAWMLAGVALGLNAVVALLGGRWARRMGAG